MGGFWTLNPSKMVKFCQYSHKRWYSSSAEKFQLFGYRNMSKALSPLPFQGNMRLTFALIAFFFFCRKQGSATRRSVRIKSWHIITYFTHTTFSKKIGSKLLVSTLTSFASIGHKGFSSLAAFLGTKPTLSKKMIPFLDVEFNAESFGSNFKSQKEKTKKSLCVLY